MKFIDLFAGIGGFHYALKHLNLECVFASEIDKLARQVYITNHNIDMSIFNEDITKISPHDIPNHDLLCAGFPCQPFSLSGLKKGFDDKRGNMFFYIANILSIKHPKSFILENVRNLIKHDNGNTFNTILTMLNDIGYQVYWKIVKASDYGLPQLRPRIYIVGIKSEHHHSPFIFPNTIPLKFTMSDVLGGNCTRDIGYTIRVGGRGSGVNDRRNWDGYIVDNKEIRLTPSQALIMMGFPPNYYISPSITQGMKQIGNSVAVDVVYHIGKQLIDYLNKV